MNVSIRISGLAVFLSAAMAVLWPAKGLAATGDEDGSFGRFGTNGFASMPFTRDMARQTDGKIVAIGTSGTNLLVRRFRVNGTVDTDFGNQGSIVVDLGNESACPRNRSCGVIIQPDKKIVVAAQATTASTKDFAVLRFTPEGDYDATFGLGGVAIVDFYGKDDSPHDLAIDNGDAIIVVGSVELEVGFPATEGERFGVLKLTTTGQLDSSFDEDGKVNTSFGSALAGFEEHFATAVAIAFDRIVVVGSATDYPAFDANGPTDFGITRYLFDGSLDTTFSGDGRKRVPLEGDDIAEDVMYTSSGIVVSGSAASGEKMAIARLDDDGELDNTFNGNGKVTFDLVADSAESLVGLIRQSDGKLVAAGHANAKIKLVRVNTNGTLDNSFSGDGIKNFNIDGLSRDLIIQPGDNLLLMTDNGIALINPDTTMDLPGSVVTGFSNGNDRAYGLTVQPDGKVLVIGESNGASGRRVAISRHLPNGDPDLPFGSAFGEFPGLTTFAPRGSNAAGRSIIVQNDGEILAAGFSQDNLSGEYSFLLARFPANGQPAVTYFNAPDFGAGDSYGVKALLQPDGKIVVVGFAENGTGADPGRMAIALVRYHSNGNLDTSFSGDGKVITVVGPGPTARARSALLQDDGKILVTGVYERNMLVMRYHSNGNLDTGFGTNGVVLANKLGNEVGFGLGIVTSGHIAVGGIVDSGDFGVLILDPDGQKCTICGLFPNDQYWRLADFGFDEAAYGFAVQDNGSMVLAGGESSGDSGVFAARFRRSGLFNPGFQIDTAFGNAGKIIHPSLYRTSARAVALYGSAIYIAGYRSNGHDDDFVLLKLSNDSETWPNGNPFLFEDGFED